MSPCLSSCGVGGVLLTLAALYRGLVPLVVVR